MDDNKITICRSISRPPIAMSSRLTDRRSLALRVLIPAATMVLLLQLAEGGADLHRPPQVDCEVLPRARTLGDFRCPTAPSPAPSSGSRPQPTPQPQNHDGAEDPGRGSRDGMGGRMGAASSRWGDRRHAEQVLALRHAPVLYHHPLERHLLTDPVQVRTGGGGWAVWDGGGDLIQQYYRRRWTMFGREAYMHSSKVCVLQLISLC